MATRVRRGRGRRGAQHGRTTVAYAWRRCRDCSDLPSHRLPSTRFVQECRLTSKCAPWMAALPVSQPSVLRMAGTPRSQPYTPTRWLRSRLGVPAILITDGCNCRILATPPCKHAPFWLPSSQCSHPPADGCDGCVPAIRPAARWLSYSRRSHRPEDG